MYFDYGYLKHLIAVLHRLLRAHPVAEATGYVYEGRLRGLEKPAKAGFVET